MVDIIEDISGWRRRYDEWQRTGVTEEKYPYVKNRRAPFRRAGRALPVLRLALISSAGTYIDGTPEFVGEDLSYREIPIEVDASDLRFAAKGYDPTAVTQDNNSLLPIERLLEFERNGIIGQLNGVFWSFSGYITNAVSVAEELGPKLVERLQRYEVQAALLVPASRVCHQSVGLVARMIEAAGIPTMTIAVVKDIVESVRPPRVALYNGELGSVAGKPNFPEHQRRILDESLRLIEPMDQPGIRQLVVELESQVELARGER